MSSSTVYNPTLTYVLHGCIEHVAYVTCVALKGNWNFRPFVSSPLDFCPMTLRILNEFNVSLFIQLKLKHQGWNIQGVNWWRGETSIYPLKIIQVANAELRHVIREQCDSFCDGRSHVVGLMAGLDLGLHVNNDIRIQWMTTVNKLSFILLLLLLLFFNTLGSKDPKG